MSADGSKFYVAANRPGGIWKFFYPPPQLPPVAVTAVATSVSFYNATLNGQVTGNYLQTAAWFEWGTTTNYGNSTAPQNAILTEISYSSPVPGLQPGVTYHFRATATNFLGVSHGADAAFTTPSSNSVFTLTIPTDAIVATSGNSPGGEGAGNVIDDSAAAKYLNFDKTNTGFTVYPSVTNRPVRAISLISAGGAPERNPSSFALYGSHDGNNFTLIASNAVPPFANDYAIQSFAVTNTDSYLAYKILFPTVVDPTNANSMQIAEVELLPYDEITSTNDAVTLSLPTGATLASGSWLNQFPARSHGGIRHQQTHGSNGFKQCCHGHYAWRPGSSVVKGLELIGGDDDASYSGREPSTVTLEGSNDGITFFTLVSVSPASPTSNKQIQRFPLFGNASGYAKYRVTFGLPQSGNTLQVGEVRLFGDSVAPTLNVRATGGANVLVSWPDAPGFNLESKTNLSQLNWNTVTNAPVLSNGVDTVTIPKSSAPIRFFRLRK